jgi:hypothetical protein
MYRNVYYNSREGTAFLRTWSEEGVRIDTEIPFGPYLYTEDSRGVDGVSIYKTPLKKHAFSNNFERSKFVKSTSNKRIFGNLSTDQQFLFETFKDQIDNEDFSKFPLKVYSLDIETGSNGYSSDHKIRVRKKKRG